MHIPSRRAAFAAACFLATTSSGRAQLPAEPQWWSAPGTGIWAAGPVNVDNGSPLNVGQLKHVASQARSYLDNVLQPWGGAGTAITTLTTQFQGNSTNPSTPVAERAENAAPVNVGQLKQVAELFYDRLAEMGLDAGTEAAARLGGTASLRPGKSYKVPWQNNLPATENNSIATIGQLKMAFGFKVDLASIAPSYLVSNFAGYPYSSEVPIPPAAAALVRETLGDSAFGNAVPSLPGVPQWLLNGNPVNLGAQAVTSEPVGGVSYKFVRLPKASAAPYQNVAQQRLELLLPLSCLNAIPPAKYSRLNYAALGDDASGDVEVVPRNRFLYLQYRFRTLPAEATDGGLPSIPVTGLRNRPGALIFCADDPVNNVLQGNDRFIAWEQRTAAAIASPYLAQKPISPLVEPFDYDSPQVAVATFPVASFVTGYPSSSQLVMCRGWFDQLTFALPRTAISNNLLESPQWPAVSTVTWHTVTMKFDLKGDSGQLTTFESGAPVIYLDGRVSGVCDWLLDLVASETESGNLSVKKRDSTIPPVIHLRWNGTQAAPLDLCGFYVGLANPLFEDVDHDGVPVSGVGVTPQAFALDHTWFEGPRDDSNQGGVVNQQNRYDGVFDAWGSHYVTWPVPSKSSLVTTYKNRGYGPGIYGPFRQEPGKNSRDLSAPVPLGELIDSDGDFLPDAWELTYFPTLQACMPSGDPDGDFIPNSYEFHHQFNPTQNSYVPGGDADLDGLTNAQECQLGFNYWELVDQGSQDPDGDGMNTRDEVAMGRDPFHADLPTNPHIVLPEVNPYQPPSLDGTGLDQWLPPGTDRNTLAFEDADEDGVEDDKDAVPYDANLTFAKVPESRYLVIPLMNGTLPEQGVPVAINNLGHVLLQPVPATNTQAGNMDKLPSRLWRSSSQVDNVPIPAAAENAPFPPEAPPYYLRDWSHAGNDAWLDLAQDRPEVLGNALWVPLAAGASYPSTTSAVPRIPNLRGFHGFVWDPVANPQGKWLPYRLPDGTSAPVPHFLHAGTLDYSDCLASTGRYLLAGGRITGSSLIHGQNLMQDPAYQNTAEEYAFFSWIANPDGLRALTMNSPVFGKGGYSHKDSQNSAIMDVGYFKSLVPELLPEHRDQSLFDATAQLGFKAFSWQGRAVLSHNPGSRPAPRRQDFPSDQAFDAAVYQATGQGSGGRKNLSYYYCPSPWTNLGIRIPLPIVAADQVDPAALNDMPDQRGQKQSIREGENAHNYYLPFSTGPFIVGGSGYWVADPASASTGGTEPFIKGSLIASPLIPADGAGQQEQPARHFISAGNALGRQGVNKRGEIIGAIEGTASGRAGTALWRNGRGHLLSNLLATAPGAALYHNIEAKAINDDGLIAATAIKRQGGLRTPVILLPVEVRDVKKVDETEDDQNIQPAEPVPSQDAAETNIAFWKRRNDYFQKNVADANIAWIDPHQEAGDSPGMPRLVAKLGGAPANLKVKWRLEVEYLRGNGYRANYVEDFTRTEDKVMIPPAAGSSPTFSNEMDGNKEWRIFETTDWATEINQRGLFGGTAKIFVWLTAYSSTPPTEPSLTFRIGGKNPTEALARTFLDNRGGTTFPYLYAIARHETFGRVRTKGAIRFYNQFYTEYQGGPIGDASVDMGWAAYAKGWPLYNLDRQSVGGVRRQNGPGGYGMFQLTLGPKHPAATVPANQEQFVTRRQIWNWQDNVLGAVAELQGKRNLAGTLRDGLAATYPLWPALPNEDKLSGLDAIVVSYYNGTGGLPSRTINSTDRKTPWTPKKTGQTRTWEFHQNQQDYVQSVNLRINNTTP